MASGATINLDEIKSKLDQLSDEDVRAQLFQYKVKQKVTTAKYYNPETAKKARMKRSAEIKLLTERAKALGIYDEINEQAGEQAALELGAAQADSEE